MIGYDAEAQLIKHYRVDKMLHIRMSDESREGKEHFKKLDMADYAKKSFGMFRGKETSVKMLVNNSLAGVIIDRFGKDVMMIPEDEDYFRVNVGRACEQTVPGMGILAWGKQLRSLDRMRLWSRCGERPGGLWSSMGSRKWILK